MKFILGYSGLMTSSLFNGIARGCRLHLRHLRPSESFTAYVFILGAMMGCTSTVTCPPDPENPRSVFLIDHGRHASLVLPDAQGLLRRYGYGDWRYYAERDTRLRSGARPLLWPTSAALGRRLYPDAEPVEQQLAQSVRVPIEDIHELVVNGNRVDERIEALEQAFKQGAMHERRATPSVDFEFVPYPRDYWVGFSSYHMIERWLESLGCDVDGFTPAAMDYQSQ